MHIGWLDAKGGSQNGVAVDESEIWGLHGFDAPLASLCPRSLIEENKGSEALRYPNGAVCAVSVYHDQLPNGDVSRYALQALAETWLLAVLGYHHDVYLA